MNHQGRTSMERLYAAGETACNGVHGKNRLASNSLLESLVFAGRAAEDIMGTYQEVKEKIPDIGMPLYEYADSGALAEEYKEIVWSEIRKARKERDV